MRKIIASLDIGSSSIKLLIGEIQKKRLNVLACVDVPSQGIKKGYIINPESAILSLKEAFKNAENLIGIPIRKVLVNVPSYNLECFMTNGSVTIKSEDKVVKHTDVIKAIDKSVYQQVEENKLLISTMPTAYILNDDQKVKNPIGAIANKLSVNDVAVLLPKKNSEMIEKCLNRIGVEVIDFCISPLADYYEFKNENTSKAVGAVVNIGYNTTTVSIFNKDILTATEVIEMGSSQIDNDLSYVYKINQKDASNIKDKLVVADLNSARPSDFLKVKDIDNNEIKISQYEASEVVISRLNELFNLVKKEINLLTKKKISYIILTGGISEIKHFDVFIEENFPIDIFIGNIEEIGARHNKYSVVLGMIKYYNSRLKLRNMEYSIFSLEEQEEFGGTHKRINIPENSILGKIYKYFFDN